MPKAKAIPKNPPKAAPGGKAKAKAKALAATAPPEEEPVPPRRVPGKKK